MNAPLPTRATLESQQGFHWTGQGYARRSWMESYAIECEDCNGLTECICEDDDAGDDE